MLRKDPWDDRNLRKVCIFVTRLNTADIGYVVQRLKVFQPTQKPSQRKIASFPELLGSVWSVWDYGVFGGLIESWIRLPAVLTVCSTEGFLKLWIRTQSGSWACERWAVSYDNTAIITHYLFLICVIGGRFGSWWNGQCLIRVSSCKSLRTLVVED